MAVITGAGSGIGRASSILFAKEGAKIVVADINDEGAMETLKQIEAQGSQAMFIKTDMTRSQEVKKWLTPA